MKIGELFVSLGIKSDKKSFDKARDDLGRFTKQADSKFAKLGQAFKRAMGGGGRRGADGRYQKGSGILGALTGDVGTVAGIGAIGRKLALPAAALGAGLVVAAKDALAFDDTLVRLDISSRGAMGSMDAVRAKVLEVSRATGVSKESLVEGSAAFVALTGDGKMAMDSMETFAKVALATGAPMADIVGSAAALNEQLGIGAKDFERTFSILIAGGKAGKIELKDMASLTASLAAGYKEFGNSQGVGGVATLGSAFQIVAKNFGSASEAATGLESLMGSLLQNAKEMKKAHGIDIYEQDGKTLRSLEAITADINAKDLNATQVLGLLKRKEAVKTFSALRDNRMEWEKIREETLRANDVAEDGAKYQKSATAQLGKAWNDIKTTITEAFTPEVIAGLVAAVKDAISFARDLAIGLGAIKDKITELTGGPDSQVTKNDQDDALDDAMRNGVTMDDIAKFIAMPAGRDRIGPRRRIGKAAGGQSEGEIVSATDRVIAGYQRRVAENQKIAKKDRALREKQFQASPTQMEIEAAATAAAFDVTAPTLPASATGGRGVTTVAPVFNVTSPNADPEQVAKSIVRQFGNFWDSQVRDLDAATGGE